VTQHGTKVRCLVFVTMTKHKGLGMMPLGRLSSVSSLLDPFFPQGLHKSCFLKTSNGNPIEPSVPGIWVLNLLSPQQQHMSLRDA